MALPQTTVLKISYLKFLTEKKNLCFFRVITTLTSAKRHAQSRNAEDGITRDNYRSNIG